MDFDKISKAIKRVIRSHKQTFTLIGSSQSKLLELASITGFAEHYKAQGFSVKAVNPKGKPFFAVKTSTNGDPWNFSRFLVSAGSEQAELHMNLKVRGAHDLGIYCVDVGIVKANCIPNKKPAHKWECLANEDLISFGEAKKLVVYPMLLAQFIGIVHEIKPTFLKKKASTKSIHPAPTLITLGHLTGNSNAIVASYPARKILVNIAENYDIRLARVRTSTGASPFK